MIDIDTIETAKQLKEANADNDFLVIQLLKKIEKNTRK